MDTATPSKCPSQLSKEQAEIIKHGQSLLRRARRASKTSLGVTHGYIVDANCFYFAEGLAEGLKLLRMYSRLEGPKRDKKS